MNVLIDSNVIIDHIQNDPIDFSFTEHQIFVSVISEAEILRYEKLTPKLRKDFEEWLQWTIRIPVTSSIARQAAEIGRGRRIKLPDLLIAASAIEVRAAVLTLNTKDFRNIPNLKLFEF